MAQSKPDGAAWGFKSNCPQPRAAENAAGRDLFDSASSSSSKGPYIGRSSKVPVTAAPTTAARGAAAASSGALQASREPNQSPLAPSDVAQQPSGLSSGAGAGADKADKQLPSQGSVGALQQVQQALGSEAERAELAQHSANDLPAQLAAELAAHSGYQFVQVLPDQTLFGSSRALLGRCSRSNRLRTLLQIPRSQLQGLGDTDAWGLQELQEQLAAASDLHHPHLLQVQEAFLGPLHLHIVLEECSAGRLLDYQARQAAAWGLSAAPGGGPGAPIAAALSPELAVCFFQQVVLAAHYYHTQLGNSTDGRAAPHPSKLSVKNTLLKVSMLICWG